MDNELAADPSALKSSEEIMGILRNSIIGSYGIESAQYDVLTDNLSKDMETVVMTALDYQAAKVRMTTLTGLWQSITGEGFEL